MSAHGVGTASRAPWTDRQTALLRDCLAEILDDADVDIRGARLLPGGAIHENWRLDLGRNGRPDCHLVLRKSAPSAIPESGPRAQEFAAQTLAHEHGVRTPRPLAHRAAPEIFGSPFIVMEYVAGTARPAEIFAMGRGGALAAELARELALIHAIEPPATDGATSSPTDKIANYRAYLDAAPQPHPVLEWGLRWLERQDLAPSRRCLTHGDFRTGNYLARDGRLAAILDWEFAEYGDPHADIGWFCAKCWRAARFAQAAGGLAPRAVFYTAYEEHAGRRIDHAAIAYWEVMAHLRWAIIALQQVERHRIGGQRCLEYALLGRRLSELEHEILELTQ